MRRTLTAGIYCGLASGLLAAAGGCAQHGLRSGPGVTTTSIVPYPLRDGVPVPPASAVATAPGSPAAMSGVVPASYQAPVAGVTELLPPPREVGVAAPAAAPGLTLDRVVNGVLLADPRLRAGFESINQANADALTAALPPNPVLFADGQLLPLTVPFTIDRQGGPPQSDVSVSYPIDWFVFGKRAAAMQAAGLGVRVSEADYADLIRQRVLQAAIAYYDVLEAKALVALARQDVESLQRVEGATQKAVDGGGRPLVELNRIRLDRLRGEQVVRDAENARVGATARLRALLGRPDADPAFDVAGKLDDAPAVEPLPDDEAFGVARQNRPDIRSLRFQVAQAGAAAEVARRAAFPSVIPQVGYTKQFQTKAIGFPDADSYSFGVTVTLPLFDRNQGNRAKTASITVQNQFQLQAGTVDLRAEVVQAGQELRTAAANSRAVAGDQLRLAQDVRESITKSYEAGGRPLLDVLDAQRNYRDTYRLFITGRASYGRAAVRYNAVLGKQFAP